MIRLILGGDKSGKSAFALSALQEGAGPHLLLATGQAADFSFRRQILEHRTARAPHIPVRETGTDLVSALLRGRDGFGSVLVDSLDFWLFACREAGMQQYSGDLAECLRLVGRDTEITLVSCEAGLGPVPADRATRMFIRELGALNQTVAALADEVCFMVAGIPMYLKRR